MRKKQERLAQSSVKQCIKNADNKSDIINTYAFCQFRFAEGSLPTASTVVAIVDRCEAVN